MGKSDRFLKACRREEVDCTPVWLMRQAGRYMKEYRDLRKRYSFMEMVKHPEIAAEVTLQPVRKIDVDAAIIFSDILTPLEGMGIELEFTKGDGPVIHNKISNISQIESLRIIEPEEDVPFLLKAISIVKKELSGKVPLIGFSGAPFTLASYIIEGGHSRQYLLTKSMMYNEPESWHLLMEKLSKVIIKYLKAQIKAGAQALQIFDSWVGCLSPDDYEKYVLPHSKNIIDGVKEKGVPIIHFATETAGILEIMKRAGGDVMGIDWRIDLDIAWKRIGYDIAIQGNLDPVVLLGPRKEIEKRVKEILDKAENRPGHIFNLGHGVLKETPVENVIAMVDAVHKYGCR